MVLKQSQKQGLLQQLIKAEILLQKQTLTTKQRAALQQQVSSLQHQLGE